MMLEWRQHETEVNCWVTACGSYCVSLDPLVDIWRAWRMEPMGAWFSQISRVPLSSAHDAKIFCEGYQSHATHFQVERSRA